MEVIMSSGSLVINTNVPAQNAYLALSNATQKLNDLQYQISTGKKLNKASDDIAGYITVNALKSRMSSLKVALASAGEAQSVASIAQDSLDNVKNLLMKIKDSASQASSGSLGTDEKVSLAKSAYQLSKQIQSVVDSAVYGGKQLLEGAFSGDWIIGVKKDDSMLTLELDLTKSNADFGLTNDFDITDTSADFAGITGLTLGSLNDVTSTDLGIFSAANISTTLTSLTNALTSVSKVGSYVGGVSNRLDSSVELLNSLSTNYKASISRIEDLDQAEASMEQVRLQFLQQTSLTSLIQANTTPQSYLQLFR
jgi:flagellin